MINLEKTQNKLHRNFGRVRIKKAVRINEQILQQIDDKIYLSHYSLSDIIELALFNLLGEKKSMEVIENFVNLTNVKDRYLRVKISIGNLEKLENLAKIHGFNSPNKMINFILHNSLNEEKIFNRIEMSELKEIAEKIKYLKFGIDFALQNKNKWDTQTYCQSLTISLQGANELMNTILGLISNYQKELKQRV